MHRQKRSLNKQKLYSDRKRRDRLKTSKEQSNFIPRQSHYCNKSDLPMLELFSIDRTLVNQKKLLRGTMQLEEMFLLPLANIREQFSIFQWQTSMMKMMHTIMPREELAICNSIKLMKHLQSSKQLLRKTKEQMVFSILIEL